nr:cache domain-containing protein [Massilia sp. CCM 9206]
MYGTDGVVRAQGANLNMLNRNLMDVKDVDGKQFVRERIELAKKNAPFWQEYKFTNPLSKKSEPKAMYCQPYEEGGRVRRGLHKMGAARRTRQRCHGPISPSSTTWCETGQSSAAPAAYSKSAH